MQTDPLLVDELRAHFKAGATPSALVRLIAERYPNEPAPDQLVRAYFREAFGVPMLRIGPDQVAQVAQGEGLPALNDSTLHRMVAMRSEWDKAPSAENAMCWLDSAAATEEAEMLRNVETELPLSSLAWWERLDDDGKRFVARSVANGRSLYERVQVLAALAEQLQQQVLALQSAGAQNL
jgi:hypothetical protein